MIEISKKKVRKPKKTEEIILKHLKEKNKEISFYRLYKELTESGEKKENCILKITSGGLQSALERLLKKKRYL